jgi:hypothetical protein
MDQKNPFESPVTYRLHRAEYFLGLLVVTALIIVHIGQVRWLPALILFAYIDLIGYIPGAVAFHRSKDGRISKVYYVLYNVMHSMVTQSAVAALWAWLVKPEWALLLLPWHLFGDRSVFGNFLKPFGVTFEPTRSPIYDRLMAEMRARSATSGRVPVPVEDGDGTLGGGGEAPAHGVPAVTSGAHP